jgi:DNA-binding FadR family transcriptional regulator
MYSVGKTGLTLMNRNISGRNKSRTLSTELAHELVGRIRGGDYAPGTKLSKEAALMEEFGVSRTVVREAIAYLQAVGMVETRHGIGSFVLRIEEAAPYRIQPDQINTLRDTIALMELRIGLEVEAAALAAMRRTSLNLKSISASLDAFYKSIEAGEDAANADFQFHREIAVATQNKQFSDFIDSLRPGLIPRARLAQGIESKSGRVAYLKRVYQEHESIYNAIRNQDVDSARAAVRTHLCNSRDRLRKSEEQVD